MFDVDRSHPGVISVIFPHFYGSNLEEGSCTSQAETDYSRNDIYPNLGVLCQQYITVAADAATFLIMWWDFSNIALITSDIDRHSFHHSIILYALFVRSLKYSTH